MSLALKRYSSLSSVRKDLLSGSITCVQLVNYYLENCEKNRNLNAFLELFPEEALQRAAEVDVKIKLGTAGKLAGMVLGIKDNICYKGHIVSGSSQILKNFESLYTATALQRLLDEDVIVIGRFNCDEFAMGASNENSSYGPVKNAIDPERVPGGSSGGSAVAVQSDMCLAALGSDTGGSIRQPASFCGIYGFKPTYGSVSRYGLMAYASSFDQIGPLASDIEDVALLTQVMSGADEMDPTTVSKVNEMLGYQSIQRPLKIAYLNECLHHEGLDSEIKKFSFSLFDSLRKEGHTVQGIDFPYLDYLVPCYYVLTTAEASSNLARYSGLLYGYRSNNATDLESTFKKSRTEGFGEEVKRRIMLGTFVLSADHYDAYYTKAQKVRRLIRNKTNEILEEYDFILLPTTSTPAFKLGEKASNPIAMYLADLFTVQANLAGNPAISIPLAKTDTGLPFGMQVMGKNFSEKEIFGFSDYLSGFVKN